MATVLCNGRFVSRDDARVSAFDAGLQHGVGLFETMTAIVRAGGSRDDELATLQRVEIVHGEEHLTRLVVSARELGLASRVHRAALMEALERTVARASMEMPDQQRFRVRLTLTGGDLNLLAPPQGQAGGGHEPGLLIVAQPATQYPRAMLERGVAVTIADVKVNPFNPFESHKTLNYWPRLHALQASSRAGASEALVFSVTNHLAGGCVSNCFVVKRGVLITPLARGDGPARESTPSADGAVDEAMLPGTQGEHERPQARGVLPSPVLPGVTRRWVMEWAGDQGLEVRRRLVTIDDVMDADEVFLTNSSWGVLPVVRVEGREIGKGVGEVARGLVEAWAGLVGG